MPIFKTRRTNMKYDHKKTKDFFSSLNYLEPKNNPNLQDKNYDSFLLRSLQIFRKKVQEIQKEKYDMKSFYHVEHDENKRGSKNKRLSNGKNKIQPSTNPLYS